MERRYGNTLFIVRYCYSRSLSFMINVCMYILYYDYILSIHRLTIHYNNYYYIFIVLIFNICCKFLYNIQEWSFVSFGWFEFPWTCSLFPEEKIEIHCIFSNNCKVIKLKVANFSGFLQFNITPGNNSTSYRVLDNFGIILWRNSVLKMLSWVVHGFWNNITKKSKG